MNVDKRLVGRRWREEVERKEVWMRAARMHDIHVQNCQKNKLN